MGPLNWATAPALAMAVVAVPTFTGRLRLSVPPATRSPPLPIVSVLLLETLRPAPLMMSELTVRLLASDASLAVSLTLLVGVAAPREVTYVPKALKGARVKGPVLGVAPKSLPARVT